MAAKKKAKKKVVKKAVKKTAAKPAEKAPMAGKKKKAGRYSANEKANILKDMAENGMTLKQTAAKYGVSVPSLCIWKRKMGVAPTKRGRKPQAVAAVKVPAGSIREQYQALLIKVGQASLEKAGLGKYATFTDLAAYVAKLEMALEDAQR